MPNVLMAKSMTHPGLYTVGWVCAIATEYVAARQFLDEVHDRSNCCIAANDGTQYTLGKMAGHNVVIAVLPNGEYGLSSATSVAKDMLNSFPNVRVGLMVGVGGGAPTIKHDIRLGDVVVSSPVDGKGGVYQYDYGKSLQGQRFTHTGFLNQPPAVLRSAVNSVVTLYEEDGHQIDERIQAVLGKRPRLRKKYGRPSPETDRLYEANNAHPINDQNDCGEQCGSGVVQRCKAEDREDNPTIHYGTIASANQLMKDATTRDALAKEQGILCFEMEAAGLMNHFPCLVVRGICDYSDSHKNKRWQGYAAMTAAAFAKDVLVRMAPNEVGMEKRIVDVLASMEQNMTWEFDRTNASVAEVKLDVRHQQLHNWLSPPDPSTNFNEAMLHRHKGTGRWFVEGDLFQFFKESRVPYLWLSGLAGCGKTVLSASIIEDLQQSRLSRSTTLLYFYFDFNDVRKQTLDGLLRSLVWQLSSSSSNYASLEIPYNHNKLQPSILKLKELLETMLFASSGHVIIVLDALDECTERSELLPWLSQIAGRCTSNVQIIITSRKEYDIRVALEKWMTTDSMLSIPHSQVDEDIRTYVRARIISDEGLKRWDNKPRVQDKIEKHLMGKAQGMFRWAKCQLDALTNCISLRQLNSALLTLPMTLHETYDRILDRIPTMYLQDTIRLLQVLTWSERPLLIEEVVDLLAVDLDSPVGFDMENRLPNPHEMVQLCSGLVTLGTQSLDPEDDNVEGDFFTLFEASGSREEIRLAHFSVKEYLISDNVRNANYQAWLIQPIAAASVASVLLTYLLCLEMETAEDEIASAYPLAFYAAKHWTYFGRVADSEDTRLHILIDKLLLEPGRRSRWLSVYNPDTGRRFRKTSLPTPEPLYYASLCGLEQVSIRLLKGGADVNTVGGEYENALQAAAAGNHENITKLLINWGANVNAYNSVSTLQVASKGICGNIVRLLLANGAHVNAHSGMYGNALQAACARSNADTVQILLGYGADVNAQGGSRYGSALQAACAKGETETVRLLLNRGADVNARGGHHGSVLRAACFRDDAEIVRVLLDSGTIHEVRNHAEIVRILLESVKCVKVEARCYSNVLEAAMAEGNNEAVRTLLGITPKFVLEWLSNGAYPRRRKARLELQTPFLTAEDVAIVDSEKSMTLLHYAAQLGSEAAARRCLELGANICIRDRDGGTPLHLAAGGGHLGVVKLLLQAGSDRNALDSWNRTPLECAQGQGRRGQIEKYRCRPETAIYLQSANSKLPALSTDHP
ncbi:hypothetical protein D6C87_07868 [Aureobasidium pullulans]|uniref:NACHT domain-containing protein n=2 Tax=Aureobasidium pullulans TaxID=5580 RepID=A0AB38LSK1_AURPU|nr:hypothetical protein D6C94_06735 [Aureobasidium pullulans]THZ38358.1 hypothetical protein D6C87_07868 [Aureobasidium pullulans]